MEQLRRRRRQESRRARTPRRGAGQPTEADVESAPQPGGQVQVTWGPMTEHLDVAHMTVGDVYRLLRRPYNIAPTVRVNVNGGEATAHTRLEPGDTLEFVRLAGEKGVS